MLRRIARYLAVIAIAVAPATVVPGASQAASARYPVWPSFLSTGCTTVSGGSNGTTIACGTGGFLLTQVNSGYQCSQVDININSFSSGPFTITATSQDGTQQNNVNIYDNGDYYMRFPNFLANNTLVIQISAPDSGAMNVGFIATSPCPVVPTSTPVPPTDTPNPSDTATNTATAGPSHTPTTIPTNTPLPSGHNTFTPTNTTTPGPTSTSTPTPGPSEIDCGEASFPLLNCNMVPYTYTSLVIPPTHWSEAGCSGWTTATGRPAGHNSGFYNYNGGAALAFTLDNSTDVCVHADQTVDVPVSGDVYFHVSSTGSHPMQAKVASYPLQYISPGNNNMGHVSAGNVTVTLSVDQTCCIVSGTDQFTIDDVFLVPDAPWTPGPTSTATPTATVPPLTSTAIAGDTQTAVASSFTPTPIPIPGSQSTAIPTDTECPGGCAVAKLTAVPGLGTVTTVDTSPFSPLAHLSLSRSSCQPFGYAQIPVPVIHGTPALGSTTPLSVTWTVPVTGAWTNYNSDGTLNISNTAIQPCAMSEIPTFVWDLTYWLSVLMCAIAWFLWLIGFVGRLSGDETING